MKPAKWTLTTVAVLGLLVTPQAAQAASQNAHVTISGPNHGFAFKSEHATAHNTWVTRFASSDSYVDVVGTAGTTVSFDEGVNSDGTHYLGVGLGGSVDKNNLPKSVASASASLTDLGIPSDKAQAYADSSSASVARNSNTIAPMDGQQYNYLNKCLNISALNGSFTGYGCGSGWRQWQDPANSSHWAISSTYKTTIQGNNRTLKGVGAEITWPIYNMLHDWNPFTTDFVPSSCRQVTDTVSIGLGAPGGPSLGFSESVMTQDCTDYVAPWNVSSLNSGARWYSAAGVPNGVPMGVNGIQAVDSPANANAGFFYYYQITY